MNTGSATRDMVSAVATSDPDGEASPAQDTSAGSFDWRAVPLPPPAPPWNSGSYSFSSDMSGAERSRLSSAASVLAPESCSSSDLPGLLPGVLNDTVLGGAGGPARIY